MSTLKNNGHNFLAINISPLYNTGGVLNISNITNMKEAI